MSQQNYKVRRINQSDFHELESWWKWSRFPVPNKDLLPENGTGGIILYKGDTPVCAGFIYLTNSKIVWIEYIVANPNYRKEDRKKLIANLIEELCLIAKSKAYKYAFTSIKNENLINRFLEAGWIKDSHKTTEMIAVL